MVSMMILISVIAIIIIIRAALNSIGVFDYLTLKQTWVNQLLEKCVQYMYHILIGQGTVWSIEIKPHIYVLTLALILKF